MKLIVKDGVGENQTIITGGVAVPVDRSSALASADPVEVAAANADRGGFYFQNLSTIPMLLSELADDEEVNEASAFLVPALGVWPPPGYPVTVAAIRVRSFGDPAPTEDNQAQFIAREW